MKKLPHGLKMKPATITFKTTHKIKTLLEKEAKEDFRSLSQQLEKIVVDHLESRGLNWREEDSEDQ